MREPERHEEALAALTAPVRLWTRSEVLAKPCPVPSSPAVYAWYFRDLPSQKINTAECVRVGDLTLLYGGISPRNLASKQRLRDRLCNHYRGDASASTLRLTLGCLLAARLGIKLQPSTSGKRLGFGEGEAILDHWMSENAFVTWYVTEQPWIAERAFIESVDLPLNIKDNSGHPFLPILREARSLARAKARALPKPRSRTPQIP